MAIVQVGKITRLNIKELQGLSTDVKPLLFDNNNGSSFYCVDNGDYYIWNSGNWYLQ